MHKYKIYPPCSPSLTLSYALPTSIGTHSETCPILHSCPSLFNIDCPGGFALVFQTCIYCILIRFTPYFTSFFSIALLPYYFQLTVHFIILSSYADAMCVSVIHSISFSFPLPIVLQTDQLTQSCIVLVYTQYVLCILCIYMYVHIYVCINTCVCICIYIYIYVYICICMHLCIHLQL
jgi:hypothetical protein